MQQAVSSASFRDYKNIRLVFRRFVVALAWDFRKNIEGWQSKMRDGGFH